MSEESQAARELRKRGSSPVYATLWPAINAVLAELALANAKLAAWQTSGSALNKARDDLAAVKSQLAACQAERDDANRSRVDLAQKLNAAQAANGTGYFPVSELEPTKELFRRAYYVMGINHPISKEIQAEERRLAMLTEREALKGDEGMIETEIYDRMPPCQRQVLKLLAKGHTCKTAGAKLRISPKTVEYHRKKIYEALGLQGGDRDPAIMATRFAIRVGSVGVGRER